MLAPLTPSAARALLSPSARFLLASALAEHDEASMAGLPWREVHWPTLVSLATFERAETHLAALLRRAPAGAVPADVQQAMVGISRVAQFRGSELAGAAGIAVDALAAAAIPALWLKGAALAMQSPMGFSLRGMGDLDVLVPAGAQSSARAALREAGWTDAGPGAGYEAHHHDAPMTWRGGLRLELHSGLFAPGHPFTSDSWTAWQARGVSVRWGHRDVFVLTPVWHLVHASVHWAWSHEGEVGTWQYVHDTRLLLEAVRTSGGDWAAVGHAAELMGGAAPVAWALWFASRVGSVSAPMSGVAYRPGAHGVLGGLTEREWVIRAWHSPAASPSVKWSRFWWRRAMGGLGERANAWPWQLGRMVQSAAEPRDGEQEAAGRRDPVAIARRWRRHLTRALGG